jgi:hypothetical protein
MTATILCNLLCYWRLRQRYITLGLPRRRVSRRPLRRPSATAQVNQQGETSCGEERFILQPQLQPAMKPAARELGPARRLE